MKSPNFKTTVFGLVVAVIISLGGTLAYGEGGGGGDWNCHDQNPNCDRCIVINCSEIIYMNNCYFKCINDFSEECNQVDCKQPCGVIPYCIE